LAVFKIVIDWRILWRIGIHQSFQTKNYHSSKPIPITFILSRVVWLQINFRLFCVKFIFRGLNYLTLTWWPLPASLLLVLDLFIVISCCNHTILHRKNLFFQCFIQEHRSVAPAVPNVWGNGIVASVTVSIIEIWGFIINIFS